MVFEEWETKGGFGGEGERLVEGVVEDWESHR